MRRFFLAFCLVILVACGIVTAQASEASEVVVVSCGEDNSYGHPHDQPMENYLAVEADVWRTDEQGSVVVVYTAAGLQVYPER